MIIVKFEINKKYKIVYSRGQNERPSFVTLLVLVDTETSVEGTDRDGIKKGINKQTITDWNEITDTEEGEY